MNVAYLVIDDSIGPPDTLDRAYPFVGQQSVAFGFPDILFGPDDVFDRLLRHLDETNSDIVLGLYPAHDVRQMDMIDVGADGRIHSIVLKPPSSQLRYTWVCAVWTAAFTQFMHDFVGSERARADRDALAYRDIDPQGDLPVGAVIKAAIEKRLRVHGVTFPDNTYIDIGTPENLIEAMRTSIGRS
jgi:glucose-1-phosphate thymidylyltransferase